MKSITAAELLETLLKSSKEELVELIMSAFELSFTTFPWLELAKKAKLTVIDHKMENTLAKGKVLRAQLLEIPEAERFSSNQDVLKLMCDINRNNDEYMRLLKKSITLNKEIYG